MVVYPSICFSMCAAQEAHAWNAWMRAAQHIGCVIPTNSIVSINSANPIAPIGVADPPPSPGLVSVIEDEVRAWLEFDEYTIVVCKAHNGCVAVPCMDFVPWNEVRRCLLSKHRPARPVRLRALRTCVMMGTSLGVV